MVVACTFGYKEIHKRASAGDLRTYSISEQRSLRQVCAYELPEPHRSHEVWLNMKALNMKYFNLKLRPLSLLHFRQHGLLLEAYAISPKSRALVYEIYLFSFMQCS